MRPRDGGDDSSLAQFTRWVVYLMFALTTLMLMVNAHDSGIAKTPLFVLCTLLVASLALAWWLRKGEVEIRLSSLGAAVLLFLLVAVASALTSRYQDRTLVTLLFLFGSTVAFFAGTALFDRKDRVRQLLNVIAWVTGIVCVIGVIQFVLGDRLGLDFFPDKNRRVGSTLGNAVFLSGYIVLVLPLMIVRVVDTSLTPKARILHGVLVISLVFLLGVSQSRSSYAAAAVSCVIPIALIARLNKRVLVLLLVTVISGAALAVVVAPNLGMRIREAFSFEPASSFARRLYFWGAGIDAFKAAPVMGHGPGSYEVVMREYRSPDYWTVKSEDVVPHAHNELVEIASDLGLSGLVVFLTIIGLAFFVVRRMFRDGSTWHRLYAAGISCALLATLVDNMANVSLRQAPVAALAWLLLGVADSPVFLSPAILSKRIALPSLQRLGFLPIAGWCVIAWFMYGSFRRTAESDARMMAGVLAHVNGRTEKAVAEFRAALAIDPENLFVRSNLCLTLLKAGRFPELLAATQEIHRYSLLYPKSNLMQAIALYSLKKYPDALACIGKEITVRAHPEAFYVQALICQGLGDTQGERRALENSLMSCVRGRIAYQIESTAGRLLALASGRQDLEHLRDMLQEFARAVPEADISNRSLQDVNLRIAQTAIASPGAPSP
jgi:O-antigen ligase